ncbi:hypothetical protein [Streptomyces sp. SP18CS02]|uniref:hypothetical protein n=1 Tax=Streptomyces sp. SP18CS02 TaxID=3002531 RepID=UPI002E77E2F4|nr:hypothetical protein [Streptomyces sp. SP18CS02]MEE1751724.1 hypothetical protein [Streptomyces sp. SP18CS02]
MGREREIRMAEGDERSRPADGPAGGRHEGHADGHGSRDTPAGGHGGRADTHDRHDGHDTHDDRDDRDGRHRRSDGRSGADGLPPLPPDDVPGLLGLLGRLLERHGPGEIALLLRDELDRREVRAYADGWRDAAAHYAAALEEARLARARTLRLVGRTPGQAAVIPFPQDRQDGDDPVRGGPPSPGPAASGPGSPAGGTGSTAVGTGRAPGGGTGHAPRSGARQEAAADEPGDASAGSARAETDPGARPAFVPKSRNSRVPTIPRLGPSRPRREPSAAPDDDTL